MLHCIQIFMSINEVTMQVKRDKEKTILHKIPLYYEYMCSCWVSTLVGIIWCFFSNCKRTLLLGFDLYITCYLWCNCFMFLGTSTYLNAMKCLQVRKNMEFLNILKLWSHFDVLVDLCAKPCTPSLMSPPVYCHLLELKISHSLLQLLIAQDGNLLTKSFWFFFLSCFSLLFAVLVGGFQNWFTASNL